MSFTVKYGLVDIPESLEPTKDVAWEYRVPNRFIKRIQEGSTIKTVIDSAAESYTPPRWSGKLIKEISKAEFNSYPDSSIPEVKYRLEAKLSRLEARDRSLVLQGLREAKVASLVAKSL